MQYHTMYSQAYEHFQQHTQALEQALHAAFLASPLHYRDADQTTRSNILHQTTHAVQQVFRDTEAPFPLLHIYQLPLLVDGEIRPYHTYLQLVRRTTNEMLRVFLRDDPEFISYAIERVTEALIQAKQQLQQYQFAQDIAIQQRDAKAFVSLAENATDGIVITDLHANITYVNPAFCRMLGLEEVPIGMSMANLLSVSLDPAAVINRVLSDGAWAGLAEFTRNDGTYFTVHLSVFTLPDEFGNPIAIPGIVRDISDQLRQEEERAELQRQIITTQQALLHELSTPIIPISNDTLVMPIIGSIDSIRAHQILEHALQGINENNAANLILDITGVPIVDTHVANVLIQTSSAARLLGARCILTGIRPEVAQTLVSLNLDLRTIETHANLQVAIARTLARNVQRVSPL